MGKKIEILGMSLDNDTVQEAMLQIESCWDKSTISTVETISMETLMKAHEDELLKSCIENLDLAIICDKEILKAAGVTSRQRLQETVGDEFFKEFMKYAVENGKTVYLLGETSEQVELLQEYLIEVYEELNVTGVYALSECIGDYDNVINEINIAEPDVVLSVVPTPQQEYFIKEHKEKLNAKIWYGIRERYFVKRGVSEMAGFAKKLIQKGMMHSMLLRYNKNEGEDSDE